jgi:hypothetical protein
MFRKWVTSTHIGKNIYSIEPAGSLLMATIAHHGPNSRQYE